MLPPFVTRRGKKGFGVPVAEWLKEKLRPLARDLLSPERVRRAGVFNADYVARLQDEHERGVANHRKLLWTLLMFELWHESFVETPRRIETSVGTGGDVIRRDRCDLFQTAYDELFSWCQEHDFAGHDPFDALNSRLFQATPFANSRNARLHLDPDSSKDLRLTCVRWCVCPRSAMRRELRCLRSRKLQIIDG